MRTRDEQKIAAIKEKALDMIVSGGFDGLSMQKLAKAAGVSPATIYIYFKDRDDLLIQLYRRESDRFFEYIFRDFNPEMDFATGMAVQWKSRARYVIDNLDNTHFMEHFKYSHLHQKAM